MCGHGKLSDVQVHFFGGVLSGEHAARLLQHSAHATSGSSAGNTSAEESSSAEEGAAVRGGSGRITRKRKAQTSFVSECALPTSKGLFRLRAYRHQGRKRHEPVVMVAGEAKGEGVHVRVHDQCQTSEVLGSKRCDCREQLDASLKHIQAHGGAVIYLQQEGRGIGLANKVAAYALQDGGLDTVDANRALGFGDDERSYECVPFILEDMGVRSVKLMTNNPFKVDSLRELGVNVLGNIPIVIPTNEHNAKYIQSKVQRMGHLIDSL
eukprot:TRINITY_DN333_c0_g1_i1.p1 TRINITY_DN333_c0_g1~~TRINITY_DN333_c0_g1_i1.p1  ORF type:complete len:266 (+),score=76.74 TRINITY_DN333_c0_g1_i1:71-868(+)